MEHPNTFRPKLDERAEFWKAIYTTSLQAFTQARWNPGESYWCVQKCKLHILQAIFRRALADFKASAEFPDIMKRGPEMVPSELYAFTTDAALKYQLTTGERDFLRKIQLEDFVAANSWGVLHAGLVTDAIASMDPETWETTVKGEPMALLSKNWRKQFQRVFHLTRKEATQVTPKWQIADFFPIIKDNSPEILRISECQHPAARRPLRLLSYLFCLNPTNQHRITVSFMERVVEALNGQEVDWPEEFFPEFTREISNLHRKHSAPKVKVEKTSIGPHITLILKAAGVLNIREELEAGYRSRKALTLEEQIPHPKLKKARGATERQPSSTDFDPTPQMDQPPVTQVYSVTPRANISTEIPKTGVLLEKLEPWQPPNPLPTMVDQICQVHRRLENLLTSFTTKAPPKLMEKMNEEFFRIQRTSNLQQHTGETTSTTSEALLKSQDLQLKQLAKQIANADSLNEINIEAIFLLEEESLTLQNTLEQTRNEVYSLKSQKGEAEERLKRLQEKVDIQNQISETKQKELDRLDHRITDMQNSARRQDELISQQREAKLKLESQVVHNRQDMAILHAENCDLKARLAAGVKTSSTSNMKSAPEASKDSAPPIDSKEKHTLTAGMSNKLLNNLRRDLNSAQEENRHLKRQLAKQEVGAEEEVISQSAIHPKTEVYHQIISHTRPPETVMQCHRAYGGLNLLLGGVSFLQAGCHLESAQAKQIWDQADATARDTFVFMWCLGQIKLPLGIMEVISGCPPFFIKRYVLRCINLMAQHPSRLTILKEPLPILRSYSHGQYHLIRNLQRSKADWFQQALNTLATEDMTICYEAVKMYQEAATIHPHQDLLPTVYQLKQFATKTFEEQQTTLSTKRFGTINHGTLLMTPREQRPPPIEEFESIGTCFP